MNTRLPGIVQPPAVLFFCDYSARETVTRMQRAASDSLTQRNGGPLGVLALREIVIGVAREDSAIAHLRALTDSPARQAGSVFAFGAGPAIRVVASPSPGILGIVVQVRSLTRARAFLIEHGILGESAPNRLTIAPAAIDGLRIAFVQ